MPGISDSLELDFSQALAGISQLEDALNSAVVAASNVASASFDEVGASASGAAGGVSEVAAASDAAASSTGHAAETASSFGVALSGVKEKAEELAKGASSSLGVLGSGFSSIAAAAGPAGLAIAATVGVALEGINKFTELASTIRAYQRVTGDSAETASRMVGAFEVLGVSTETVDKALFRLGRQIQDGTQKLGEFGIQVVRSADGSVNLTETFLNVADAVKAAGGGAKASEIAFAAFGRQGLQLLPVLLKGRDGLQEFGKEAEVLSQRQLDQAKNFQITQRRLGLAFRDLAIDLGQVVLPVVETVAKGITNITRDVAGFVRVVQSLTSSHVDLTQAQADGLSKTFPFLPKFKASLDESKASETDLASAVEAGNQALADQAQAAQDAAQAQQEMADAIDGVARASESYLPSTQRISSAERDLAKDTAALAKAHGKDYAEALDKAKDSVDRLASAQADEAQRSAEASGQAFTDIDHYNAYRDAVIAAKDRAVGPLKNALIDLVNHLPPKEVVTEVVIKTTGVTHALGELADLARAERYASGTVAINVGGGVRRSAGGGDFPQGGWSWVGEQEAELLYMPPGSKVRTKSQAGADATNEANRGGTATVTINTQAVDADAIARRTAALLAKQLR